MQKDLPQNLHSATDPFRKFSSPVSFKMPHAYQTELYVTESRLYDFPVLLYSEFAPQIAVKEELPDFII